MKKLIILIAIIILIFPIITQAITYGVYSDGNYSFLPAANYSKTWTFPWGLNISGMDLKVSKNIIASGNITGNIGNFTSLIIMNGSIINTTWAYNQTLGLDYAGFYNITNNTIANYILINNSNASYSTNLWDSLNTPNDFTNITTINLNGGNVTINQGWFNWLGDQWRRITGLWIIDIDTANLTVNDNLSIYGKLYVNGKVINDTWAYNQTLSLNLAQYLDTFNTTYDNSIIYAKNIFNQYLNTTNNVKFNNVNSSSYVNSSWFTVGNVIINDSSALYIRNQTSSIDTQWVRNQTNSAWDFSWLYNQTLNLNLAQYLSTFNNSYWVENSSTKFLINQTINLKFIENNTNVVLNTINTDLVKPQTNVTENNLTSINCLNFKSGFVIC